MRLCLRQRLIFHPEPRARHPLQLLRMTPRECSGQSVLEWSLRDLGGGSLVGHVDGFGNPTHLHSLAERRDGVLEVEGVVETRDTAGVVRGTAEPLRPPVFLRATALTAPGPGLRELALDARAAGAPLEQLHRLLALVHESPAVSSADAQGRAHAFIAASRLLGHPARSVSGYLCEAAGDRAEAVAGHAWAEAWLPHLGWVGFDASRGVCPTEHYVRIAVGLDSRDSSPVRSLHPEAAGQASRAELQVHEVACQ